jgi:hypothetical protein
MHLLMAMSSSSYPEHMSYADDCQISSSEHMPYADDCKISSSEHMPNANDICCYYFCCNSFVL